MKNNVFLYWIGKEYKLIKILRNLIYLHSKNGDCYKVNLISNTNINDYIKNIPSCFYNLCPAHQADFVRVNVICDFGGIWLDSDTIIIDKLDCLFDIINNKNGFFIKENGLYICNGVFGSKKNTELMIKWKNYVYDTLNNNIINKTNEMIKWTLLGSEILNIFYKENNDLYNGYEIFNGLNNMYPVDWCNCVTEYIDKNYDNYKNIEKNFQPLIILVNSVYKNIENKSIEEILYGYMPINYFINKSFSNLKLIDYDFIEIGSNNFDTLIEKAKNDDVDISIDIVKHYFDSLLDKKI